VSCFSEQGPLTQSGLTLSHLASKVGDKVDPRSANLPVMPYYLPSPQHSVTSSRKPALPSLAGKVIPAVPQPRLPTVSAYIVGWPPSLPVWSFHWSRGLGEGNVWGWLWVRFCRVSVSQCHVRGNGQGTKEDEEEGGEKRRGSVCCLGPPP
jgi:hypothetical protein